MTTHIPYAEVIGDPIAHSKSPLIHGFWLERLGLSARYERAHVTADGLPAYIASRRDDPDWRGCNVTIPHKIAVMEHVDDPGDVRGTIGAMNTVLRQPDGRLIGTNTDPGGFLAPIFDLDLGGAPVIVVGAGGAARAILWALAKVGAGPVTLLARNPLKGAGLLARYGLRGEVRAMDAALPPAALLVNASPLGMVGQPALDLDLSPLPAEATVYDIVTTPHRTPLLIAAEARELGTVDGLEMLIGQAALAFALFFGPEAPREHDDELRLRLGA